MSGQKVQRGARGGGFLVPYRNKHDFELIYLDTERHSISHFAFLRAEASLRFRTPSIMGAFRRYHDK
jgi:hypothetical protein